MTPRETLSGLLCFLVLSGLPARGAENEPPFGKHCCSGWVQAPNLLSGNRLSATVLLDTDMIHDDDVKERWLWRWEVGSDSANGASLLHEKCPLKGVAAANIDPLANCPGWLQQAQAKAGFGKGGDQPLIDLFPKGKKGTVVVVRARQIYTGRSFFLEDGNLFPGGALKSREWEISIEIGSDLVVDAAGSSVGLKDLTAIRRSVSGKVLGVDRNEGIQWCSKDADAGWHCESLDTTSGLSKGTGDSPSWLWPTGRDAGPVRNNWRPLRLDALMGSPDVAFQRFAGGIVQVVVVDIETGKRKGAWEVPDRLGDVPAGPVIRLPSGELISIGRRPVRTPDRRLGFDWVSINGSNPGKPRHVTIE